MEYEPKAIAYWSTTNYSYRIIEQKYDDCDGTYISYIIEHETKDKLGIPKWDFDYEMTINQYGVCRIDQSKIDIYDLQNALQGLINLAKSKGA